MSVYNVVVGVGLADLADLGFELLLHIVRLPTYSQNRCIKIGTIEAG